MKQKKCILCKKRKTKQGKPFCSYCYKKGGTFSKIKALKGSKFNTQGGKYNNRVINTGKMYSRSFKTIQERNMNEDE